MTVTYAWKIDSQLYAYLVNDTYLDNGGNLTDSEKASSSDFMGVLYTERLSTERENKIYLFCKSNFPTHSADELETYTKYFDSMVDKIHNYQYPSYWQISLYDAETYFNVDDECETEKECCVYIPDGDDVSDCNKQGNYKITTKYTVGGIPQGTPLSALTGLSFSEILNMIFFGDQCSGSTEWLYVEPDTLNVDAKNQLFVVPDVINVDYKEIDVAKGYLYSNANISTTYAGDGIYTNLSTGTFPNDYYKVGIDEDEQKVIELTISGSSKCIGSQKANYYLAFVYPSANELTSLELYDELQTTWINVADAYDVETTSSFASLNGVTYTRIVIASPACAGATGKYRLTFNKGILK